MIKTLESQVGQFLLGCKCPVKRGIVVQGQNHLGELPAAFFLPNILQLHQQRCVTLSVDSLVLGKIINEEDAVLAQKIEARILPVDFCTRIFLGGGRGEQLCATPLIVALSLGHSDTTTFRPWSPIATGNHLDRAEKISKFVQTTGTVDVFDPRSGTAGPTSRRGSACPDLHE